MKKHKQYLFTIILCCICVICLKPFYVNAATSDSSLKLTSKYAIVIDMDTGEVIYSLNSESKTQMASTTKLMTAILLSENRQKSDILEMSAFAKTLPSSSIVKDKLPQMPVGEKITADNVMKGLLMTSGNDMAEIIAENIKGSVKDFSVLMNDKAKELNMNNTHFYTPNGLDSDNLLDGNEHYSTAYDMGLLGIEAFKHQWIKDTIALEKSEFTTVSGLKCDLRNTNSNLNKNGCLGGKTGYTDKAGKCLVAFYNKNNRNLVGVVLGGESPGFFTDMNTIIDYSFKKEKEPIISKNETLKNVNLTFKPSKYTNKEVQYDIPVFVKEDITEYKNDFNDKNTSTEIKINDNIDSWNLDKNTSIGKLSVTTKLGTNTYDLYTNMSTSDFVNDNSDYINTINRNVKIIKYCIIAIVIIIILLIYIAYRRIQYVKRMKRRKKMRQAKLKGTYKTSKRK